MDIATLAPKTRPEQRSLPDIHGRYVFLSVNLENEKKICTSIVASKASKNRERNFDYLCAAWHLNCS